MAGKYPNRIAAWRKHRGLTQRQLVARMSELAGDNQGADPDRRVPQTEASLSRIEAGTQNFGISALHAIADALSVDEVGWLLDRDPSSEGEVIDLMARLSASERHQAHAVLEAMFGIASTK